MTNVIKFPKIKDETGLPTTRKDARVRIHKVRKEYIDDVLDELVENVVYDMDRYGFHRLKTEDIAYLREIINATICRASKVEHFLHDTIDRTVVLTDGPEK